MQFDSLDSFIAMGGHGFYVWLSFGIGLLVLCANIAAPIFKRKELLKALRKRVRRESRANDAQA